MRCVEIESLLEVHVDQVIAADEAVEGQRAAEDVDAGEARRLSGLGHQVARDVFEIRELAPELLHQIGAAGNRLVVRANRHRLFSPIATSEQKPHRSGAHRAECR
jgi:hypothetical protein